MGIQQVDMMANLTPVDNPLSKRRRFTPTIFPPIIPVSDNSSIENHVFDSPLILQLCEQAPLPAEIQADLINVGMRVRKAVPEGYKNHKFTPRPFFNMRRLSPETQAAICGSPKSDGASSPYGGSLHNVGALAVQPIATATFCGISLSALAAYESSSSTSTYGAGGLWNYSTSSKRNLELDEDSEQDWSPQTPMLMAENGFGMPIDYFNMDMENMIDAEQLAQAPRHRRQDSVPFKPTAMPELNIMGGMGRRVARPKTRIRNVPAVQPPPTAFNPFANMTMLPEHDNTTAAMTMTTSHHTRVMSCGMELNLNDFGEASFLQRREDVDMDCS